MRMATPLYLYFNDLSTETCYIILKDLDTQYIALQDRS